VVGIGNLLDEFRILVVGVHRIHVHPRVAGDVVLVDAVEHGHSLPRGVESVGRRRECREEIRPVLALGLIVEAEPHNVVFNAVVAKILAEHLVVVNH